MKISFTVDPYEEDCIKNLHTNVKAVLKMN
jgi:hypothetical protein